MGSRRSAGARLTRKPSSSLARPRGVLLLGVSGTGKSAFCKALGNEVGRPTLMLDIGALMGSLVGMTEERTRQALRIADAMAPCIVFIDEIEKGLSGVQASGQTDSGVSARMFGTLLSYLNDHESDVYFVCSANDVSKLPPEFTRAERFDAIFFLDLPGSREKEQIWRLYLERFGLDPAQKRPSDRDFTGAEIRACCRLAALLDVPLVEAAANIVAGGRDGRRVGRTPPELGGRPMPVGRPARHLLARGCQPRQGGTQRPSRRPVGQLTPGLSSLRTSSHYSHNSRNALRRSILRIVRISRVTFHSAGPARRPRSSTLLITPS